MRTIEKNMGTKNCIAIGINRYNFFQPLSFASADAIGIENLLRNEVNWPSDRCLILTDTSPPWVVTHTNENFMTNQEEIRSTYPTKNNIIDIMQDFALKTLKPGDLFWLFFSGYGVTFNGDDYLMPIDGNPEKILETGISISWLFDQLIKTGSSVILFLDINRSQGLTGEHPVGFYTTKLAEQCGIPTILSCQLDQFSHEAPGLGQGLFTAVLLEGLRYDPQTTLNTLDWYLRTRLPELSEHHWLPVQIPLSVIPSPQIGDRTVLALVNNPQNQMNPNSVADIIPPGENTPRLPSAAIIPVSQISNFSPSNNHQNNLYQLPPVFTEKEAEIPPVDNNSNIEDKIVFNFEKPKSPPTNNTNSFRSRTSLQPEKVAQVEKDDEDDEDDEDEKSPSSKIPLWQTLAFWGTGALLVLAMIFGVFWRNQKAFVGGETAKKPEKIKVTKSKSEGKTTGQKTAKNNNQKNGKNTGKNQVDPNKKKPGAIIKAPKPGEKNNKKPVTATNKGKITEAEIIVNAAKKLTKSGDPSSYEKAMIVTKRVDPNEEGYDKVKSAVNEWSQKIYIIAQNKAKNNKFEDAVNAANLIPKDADVYTNAQKSISKWQKNN